MTTTLPTLPTLDRPCPPFCALPQGHGAAEFDADAGTLIRGHESAAASPAPGMDVTVSTFEHMPGEGVADDNARPVGASTFTEPAVMLYGDAVALTPAQARAVADALMGAARQVDLLMQAQRW